MTTSPTPLPRGRERVALHCDDASQFAKSLRQQLADHLATQPATAPSHQQLLHMLARAAGHRNWQALRAAPGALLPPATPAEPAVPAVPPPAQAEPPAEAPLGPHARKALTQFDTHGRLVRWPYKFSVQRLAMWGLWMRFDSGRVYTEREVNEILKAWTTYGDHVTPRRELVEMGLLAREADCSAYWKQPQRPDAEIRALLAALRARGRGDAPAAPARTRPATMAA
ncbi:DUF2087 domain-containing protein [Ideonella sp.]|uniref:DUF2087 domain-containing protein n=1 Tax=Ideonella sp. TaxID=1929293 RepID=UPI0035B15B76